jgi:transketolase
VFGKLRYLRRGGDVCILAYGPITKMASDLAAKFEARGESVSLVSVHTLKPLDTEGLVDALASHRRVVVIEETAPYALGLRVKALAWESQARCRIDTFSLKDAFIHTYGAPAELLAAHGLELSTIAAQLGLS